MTISILQDRAVVRVSGDAAPDFLDGLLTNRLPGRGETAFACLLTPQGKILFEFIIRHTDDGFLLDVHRAAAEALVKRLTLYRLRAKVEIAIDETKSVIRSDEAEDDALALDPRSAALGYRGIVEATAHYDADAGYHGRRIRAGVPECVADFEADSLFLMDVNYDRLNGVSYSKGCFVGQEVASRMKRKGEVRRRTLCVEAEDAGALQKGAEVRTETSTLGSIIAVDGVSALATIRLDRLTGARQRSEKIRVEETEVRLSLPEYLNEP